MQNSFFKECYDAERQQQQSLLSFVGVPIGAISLVGGAAITMFQSFPFDSDALTYIFLGFTVPALCALAYSICALIRMLVGYKGAWIGSAKEFAKYYQELKDWSDRGERPEGFADKRFEQKLNEKYAEAATHNRDNNKRRSGFLANAMISLVVSVVLVALAAIPYTFAKQQVPDKLYQVELVGKNSDEMEDKMEESITEEVGLFGDDDDSPPSSSPISDDPEPTVPETEYIRESEVPPRDIPLLSDDE